MELTRNSKVFGLATLLPGLVLLLLLLNANPLPLDNVNVHTGQNLFDLESVIVALESGSIPSDEEVAIWQGLLQRLKNQVEAGVPLSEEQIEQLQRIYNLTAAYVPWLEDFFELLKSLIQEIVLSNAALEMELNNPPNNGSDE